MTSLRRLRVSLNITGELVDPGELTAALGAKPDRSHRVGDPVGRKSSPRRTGLWSISTDDSIPDTAPIAQHIEALLARVTADELVWRSISERHTARVFVGWFMEADNEEDGLPPAILGELSRRSLTLDFDMYCFSESVPGDPSPGALRQDDQ